MSRRANGQHRCDECRMHQSLCICALVPRLRCPTRLRLIIHRRETFRTTNTGALAARCVEGSEIWEYGHRHWSLAPPYENGGLLLFPSDDAEPLRAQNVASTLYVPDGSWRQASRMVKKLPWLARMKRVYLPPGGEPSQYRLRSGRNQDDLATAEAIARALGILEGPHIQRAIEQIFRVMVERTLFSRGQLSADKVTGGIPPGVRVHAPWRTAASKD